MPYGQTRHSSRDPVGEKHIEFTGNLCMTVGHPDQPRPIGRKHGKTVELPFYGKAFQAGSVISDEEQMETWSAALAPGLNVG